jgi:hypothetical protein
VESTVDSMEFSIELTGDRDHKTVIKEIRMSAVNSTSLISRVFSLVRDVGSPVEGFRILDKDGVVHAAAWIGAKPALEHQ